MAKPTTCASCGKRLSKKHWYYRNGQSYCNRRCFDTAQEKAKQEQAAKAEPKAEQTGEQKPEPQAEPKAAQPAA